MVTLGIHLLILLSLPLTTLCRQYKVVSEPSAAGLCLVFTVANGGNETQVDAENPETGRFDSKKGMCIPADDRETDEDRCDPDLSKEAYTERMVRAIRLNLITNHGMVPALIIRQPYDSGTGQNTLPGEEWAAFDAAIDKAVNQDCRGKRGLTLDFIARDRDHGGDLITLGYLISGTDLAKDDDNELMEMLDLSSIRALGFHEYIPFTTLLRGPLSLGQYLWAAFKGSAKVVPSPQSPSPEDGKETEPFYYSGGYTVKSFGSRNGKFSMDAIQMAIAKHFMMGESRRQDTAGKMAKGIYDFMKAIHLT